MSKTTSTPSKSPVKNKTEQNATPSPVDIPSTGEGRAGVPSFPPTSSTPEEFGGPKGPEPTRYGDWEQKGRCTDF